VSEPLLFTARAGCRGANSLCQ